MPVVARAKRVVLAAAIAGLVATSSSVGIRPARAAVTPSARAGAAMAFDGATGTTLLFGGTGENSLPLNDTWTWNGTIWTQEQPVVSPPLGGEANSMAYDPSSRTVVLLTTSGDTWTWNGNAVPKTWVLENPANEPSQRREAAMAYDKVNRSVLLFGGNQPGSPTFNDTWLWNGTAKTWTLQAPQNSPPARERAAIEWDPTIKRVVLFGGLNAANETLNDTWTWNGTAKNWVAETTLGSPPARLGAKLRSHAKSQRLVLFGGYGGHTGYLGDTWIWNGLKTKWVQLSPGNQPYPRSDYGFAPHVGTGQLVLFGGRTDGGLRSQDTWAWNGTTWKPRT